jgi:hypothetical protein
MKIQETQKPSIEAREGEGSERPSFPKCTEKEGNSGTANGMEATPPKPTAVIINRGRVSYMAKSFQRQAAE